MLLLLLLRDAQGPPPPVQWIPVCLVHFHLTGERLLSDSRRCLVKPIVIGCCVGHTA